MVLTTSVRRSLLGLVSILLILFIPHVLRPIETTPIYAPMMGVLVAVGVGAWFWAKTSPARALQSFWWSVLAVCAAMIAVDAHTGNPFPYVVAAPPIVGAVFIQGLLGLRAMIPYGGATVALLIPTGLVYDNLGQAAMLAVGVVGIAIYGIVKRNGISELQEATRVLEADNARLADAEKRFSISRE